MNARWILNFCWLAPAIGLLGGPVQAQRDCKLSIGSPAPLLIGQDLSGERIDLGSMRGKWVYLDFWASWCKPCMRELPGVVDLHEELGERGDFAVMSIALDDNSTLGELKKVREKYRVDYPVVYDNHGWASPHVSDWCVDAIPTTFLIDPSGKVVERDLSPSQVRSYISRTAPPQAPGGYQPLPGPPSAPVQPDYRSNVLGFNAKHRLLRDSPTSGKRNHRDLQISLPSPGTDGSVRYLLVVRGDEGQGGSARIRYDLEFTTDSRRSDFPFAVAIREASGDRTERLPSGEKSVLTGAAVDFLPGAQISYDAREKRLLFILPLPGGLRSAAYTASAFNHATGSFDGTLAADISF